jgi:hypothetical protein
LSIGQIRTAVNRQNLKAPPCSPQRGSKEKGIPMKMVVTGGADFINSHGAEVLVNEGHDVVVMDDF